MCRACHAQPRGALADVQTLVDQRHGLPGLAVNLGPVHPAAKPGGQSLLERHVLGHGERGERFGFLMHADDAVAASSHGAGPRDFLASPQQTAGIGRQDSTENVDQRALARAILADQGMHFAGQER